MVCWCPAKTEQQWQKLKKLENGRRVVVYTSHVWPNKSGGLAWTARYSAVGTAWIAMAGLFPQKKHSPVPPWVAPPSLSCFDEREKNRQLEDIYSPLISSGSPLISASRTVHGAKCQWSCVWRTEFMCTQRTSWSNGWRHILTWWLLSDTAEVINHLYNLSHPCSIILL